MNITLKRVLIGLGILVLVLAAAMFYLNSQNRKNSPAGTAEYKQNGFDIGVTYSRPSKHGRAIFGQLVPYGKIWRTGANEATTFSTKTPLTISGKPLPAGDYTLWTIPQADAWTVIFNKGEYTWGINFDQTSPREPESDVLLVKVPVTKLPSGIEQFTISFEEPGPAMVFNWDMTSVRVPIGK